MSMLTGPRIAVVVLVAALSACSVQRDDPRSVTERFWEAIDRQDMQGARALATASSAAMLEDGDSDGGFQEIRIGEATVEGDRARVATYIRFEDADGAGEVDTHTSLVRVDGQWKVDYPVTVAAIVGGTFGQFIRQASEEFMKDMEEAGRVLEEGMEALKRELEKMEADAARRSDPGT